ncbi:MULTISPECIES: SPOR domain-containing protein [Kordiimonas]|jgi:cell division septation protein DedD|uniref:Sporulation related domain-containing protein n=1 Tax=Kordiimonas lacus TaxID=637679 RepID=A0A1G6VQ31_9PROT|nr:MULTISPECIES: SPOR domain-containing protein [Kordiimonas]SDD55722.1 Sporulation related domain-containing protein [Kordiimonas lacus]
MSENEQQGADKDIPPWLQPVPEEEEAAGFFEGRKTLVITAAAALSVVVLFVLVLLYLYDSAPDGPPRHVVAEATPIKTKPTDPGGMDVPNQDKQVFDQGAAGGSLTLADQPEEPLKELPADPEPEVVDDSHAEDEARIAAEAQAREQAEAEAAKQVAAQAAKPEAEAEKPAAEPAVPAGAFKVQLGAYGSEESAATAWRTIRGKHRDVLDGLSPVYESVRTGDRTLYRLRVGPLESRAAADEVCLGLRAQQQACIVVNP